MINGVQKLHGLEYKVMPDKIEAATFVTLAAVTKSPLKITNCRTSDLKLFLDKIHEMGGEFETGDDFVYIKSSDGLKPIDIKTDVYPGFATDWQPLSGLLMTQAEGNSIIEEAVFENRLGYLKELVQMGAKIEMVNGQKAVVTGPTNLHGAQIESLDIRAGATMILAGLIADGQTIIENAEIIDRGYEKIEERLKKVGAKIERI